MSLLLSDGPWAVLLSHLQSYIDADTPDLMADADPAEADAMYAVRTASHPRRGSVAVVPIFGPLTKRDSLLSVLFGGTSTNRLIATFDQLAADESVSHVLLNVDSPGGSVSGLPEAAASLRRLASVKPVTAITTDLNASAAYWLTSQANEIVATPESLTGSIGVFAIHQDISAALEADGVKITLISSSPEKVEGNPTEPLSDDAREHMQGLVDSSMDLFVADVAKGRDVSTAKVRGGFGNGRVLDAKAAKAAGLVDRIGSFSDTLARLSTGRRGAAIAAEVVETERLAAAQLEVDLARWQFHR